MNEDFIVPKKSANISGGRKERNEDEGHIVHKKPIERGRKSPIPPEMRTIKEGEACQSPNKSKDDLDLKLLTSKLLEQRKEDRKLLHSKGNVFLVLIRMSC